MFQWIYLIDTGEFLFGGPCELHVLDPQTQGLVVLSRNPDIRGERYDGSGGIRAATQQELSDYDAIQTMKTEQRAFDSQRMLRALAIWTAGKLNVQPNIAKQEILGIYRSL